jgi:D-alanyl-D-alanine carboxypeptidase/D-alanyl-D-alanine-endopeptidase (penicillin-binding protein 4)
MRCRATLWLLLFTVAFVSAQTPQEALEAFLREPALRGAWVGVLVETTDETPKVLLAHDADKRFMPASNAKLFTVALALERLGEDFTFRTPLLTDGKREGATLVGNLYLRGVGDPSLTRQRLLELAKQVVAQGIQVVKGDLVVDVSAFTDNRWGTGWAWDYLAYGYAPEVWAIALDRNAITVQVAPANLDGVPAKVTLTPPTDWLTIDNRIQTVATVNEADWSLWREAWERTLHLWGRIPMTANPESVRISVPNVPHYVGTTFRQRLNEVGVRLEGSLRIGNTPADAKIIAETPSAPLRELVRWLNKVSDNLYAEMLLRAVALKGLGRGDVEGAMNLLREQLKAWGIEPTEVRLVDGSGLSRLNMVTPHAIVRLLQVARRRPWFAAFRESLPIAGVDGTLANRFRGTAAEKRLVAKTGFIGGVVTISGYLQRQDGSEWVFSVMVNHFTAPTRDVQNAVDRFLAALVR